MMIDLDLARLAALLLLALLTGGCGTTGHGALIRGAWQPACVAFCHITLTLTEPAAQGGAQ